MKLLTNRCLPPPLVKVILEYAINLKLKQFSISYEI
jgi:hypothetical protein